MAYLRFTPNDSGGWDVHTAGRQVAAITGQPGQWVVRPAGLRIAPDTLRGIEDFLATRPPDDSAAWLDGLYRLPDPRLS